MSSLFWLSHSAPLTRKDTDEETGSRGGSLLPDSVADRLFPNSLAGEVVYVLVNCGESNRTRGKRNRLRDSIANWD